MVEINVHAMFIEGVLGSSPNDEEIYSRFVAAKAPDASSMEDEVAAIGVKEFVERGTTVFPRNSKGEPFLYDYQIKGFFKDTCGALSKLTTKDPETGKKGKPVNESSKLTAYKKIIDKTIFVEPRRIVFKYDGDIGTCQRPLRASTAKCEVTALASSEEIHAGAEIWFKDVCMSEDHVNAVIEWLNHGYYSGIGQWRNSGKGRFVYEVLKKNGDVMFGNMDLAEEYMSA